MAFVDINLRDVTVFPVADAPAARRVPFVIAAGYDGAVIPTRRAHIPRCGKPVALDALARALFAPSTAWEPT